MGNPSVRHNTPLHLAGLSPLHPAPVDKIATWPAHACWGELSLLDEGLPETRQAPRYKEPGACSRYHREKKETNRPSALAGVEPAPCRYPGRTVLFLVPMESLAAPRLVGLDRVPPGLELPVTEPPEFIPEDYVERLVPVETAYLAPELV